MVVKWPWITLSRARMERRLRQNGVVLFFSLIIFLSVWQIISGPGPPLFFQVESHTSTPSPPSDIHYIPYTQNTTYTSPIETLNTSDYSQLIDLKNFSFTMFNSACNETYPFLIILIHTAPQNFAKRKTIRDTWGQSEDGVKLLFMLGLVEDDTLQMQLKCENETYGDFVQGSFLDSYRNVTYKHAMVFKYVIYHCQSAKYLLKTDDDVFINSFAVLDYLKQVVSPYGASNLLLCNPNTRSYALRSYRSKWRVSFSEYPQKVYPPYCPGWALLYSKDVVFRLYKELQNNTYFWIDDVLITGILVEKLKLVHSRNQQILSKYAQYAILYKNYNSTLEPFLFGRGEQSEEAIRRLWNYTMKYVRGKHRQFTNQNLVMINS